MPAINELRARFSIVGNAGYCQLCRIRHSWHACEHLKTASDHAVPLDWYERYRHILRHDPDGVEKVIRSLRYLRDKATTGKDDIKRELAFFQKNRHRMRYRQLKDQRLPIGSGVVEAANKVLVTQRLKRSGDALEDRRRPGGLDFPRPDQVGPLRHGMGDPDGVNHRSRKRQSGYNGGDDCRMNANNDAGMPVIIPTAARESHSI